MPLSRAVVDRAARFRFDQGLADRLFDSAATRLVLIRGGEVAVSGVSPALALFAPSECRHLTGTAPATGASRAGTADHAESAWQPAGPWAFLGAADGIDYVSLVLPDGESDPGPEGTQWYGIREIGGLLSDQDTGLAVTALSLARWQVGHRFCPACGTATVPAEAGWASTCPGCGATHYPRTDPAVIMAITDSSDRLLLGRGSAWRESNRFSVLAGYVEAGESLEAAVRREVAEEAGVEVGAVRYVGNQPWPPSGSLMVAFDGVAMTTELSVDHTELAEARWFTREELDRAEADGEVELPPPAAIAHTLINAWRTQT